MRPKTIDAANARRLAVQADVDPKTIHKVVAGNEVRGMAGERAVKVLATAGYITVGPDGRVRTAKRR